MSLFEPDPVVAMPAVRGRVSGYGGQPDRMLQVLDETEDGRYVVIETTGRPVEVIEDGMACRITDAEAILDNLIRQHYLTTGNGTACKHGAVWKRVVFLRITPSGEKLRRRWTSLCPAHSEQSVQD